MSSAPEYREIRGRGFVTMQVPLPRYVISKRLKSAQTSFYFNVPQIYIKAGCPRLNEPLGEDYVAACGQDGKGGRAAILNGLFDEWDQSRKGAPISSEAAPAMGSVDWLFREYKQSKAYLEKIAIRSRKRLRVGDARGRQYPE
jgi:hypothetical protein